jgi:hypothetical protein
MTLRTNHGRLTVLGWAAILSGLVGCSMFKEKVNPKLNAEVVAGEAAEAAPPAKYVVELRPEKGKPQSVEKTLGETTHVQEALEKTGAIKKFKRATVQMYRPLPSGGWHKMELEFDKENHRIPPEYDYAILAGDRIVVTEDTATVFDDLTQRALAPLGITPKKKTDPVKERYQIQG